MYSYILYIDDAFKPCVHMLPFAPPLFHTKREKALIELEVHNIPPPQVSELVLHPTSPITCVAFMVVPLWGVVGGDGFWSFFTTKGRWEKSFNKDNYRARLTQEWWRSLGFPALFSCIIIIHLLPPSAFPLPQHTQKVRTKESEEKSWIWVVDSFCGSWCIG